MVRLFSGGYSTILAVIAAFFATLYVYDTDPETWKTEISGTYSHSPQVLFQFLTVPKNILQVYIIVKNIYYYYLCYQESSNLCLMKKKPKIGFFYIFHFDHIFNTKRKKNSWVFKFQK